MNKIKNNLTEDMDPKESRVWVIGTTVFVTGSLLNFGSYSLAPQSLLASLEAIQFVTNVAFGSLVLGKVVTARMYFGTSLCITGTILAILFSSKQAAVLESVDDLLALWLNPLWIGYIITIGALGVGIQAINKP